MSKQGCTRGGRNFKEKSVRAVEEDLEKPIDKMRALNSTVQASSSKPYMVTRVYNNKSVQLSYGFYTIWIGCHRQSAVNMLSCETQHQRGGLSHS